MMRWPARAGALAALALVSLESHAAPSMLGLLGVVPKSFAEFRLSSMGFGGLVAASNVTRFGDARDVTSTQVLSLNANYHMNGYYWRPWFANWDAGVSLDVADVYGDEEAGLLSGMSLHGGVALFPSTRYPFKLRMRLRQRNDGFWLVDDYQSTSFLLSANQDYRSPTQRLDSNFNFTWENDSFDITPDRERLDLSGRLSYAISPSADASGTANYWREYSDGSLVYENATINSRLDHRRRLPRNISLSNYGLFTATHSKSVGFATNTAIVQAISNASWRPAAPYSADGTASLSQTYSDSNGSDRYSTNANLGGGYNHILSNTLSWNTSANTFFSTTNNDGITTDRYGAGQSARINYRPLSLWQWAGFRHSWSAQASESVRYDNDTGGHAGLSGGAQENLTRTWQLGPFVASFNHGAGLGANLDTDNTTSAVTLSHSLNLNWGRAFGRTTHTMNAIASDGRSYQIYDEAGDLADGENQRVFVDYTQQINISRTQRFNLSANFSATRTSAQFVGQEGYDMDSHFETRASYSHTNLYGLARLNFDSRLRFTFDDPLGIDEKARSSESVRWDNILTYRIGRLQLNTRLDFNWDNERLDGTFFVRAERRFGR